jgi:hypothetical protein
LWQTTRPVWRRLTTASPAKGTRPLHVSIGTVKSGTVQLGRGVHVPPTVTLAGSISFQWRLHYRLLGSVTQLTSANIQGVDDGDPTGYSAACTIEPAM